MRRLLSFTLMTGVLLAGESRIARGQEHLKMYSDPALTQCVLADEAVGTATVHIAWIGSGADWVRFRVAASSGFTGVWLSDSSPYTLYGSSQTDLTVAFNACKGGTVPIVALDYQLFGTSTCSELAIAPPPGFLFAEFDDCDFAMYPLLNNGSLHVNCAGPFGCGTVAAEPTTWGRVKSLYRN
jgi:hypothetical protein